MELTIFRGANQIGGSIINIATAKTRLIFDLGLPLDSDASCADKKLDLTAILNTGQPVDAMLLSHSHLDHCGLLPEADPKIPVYLSQGADKALSILKRFAGQDVLGRREVHRELRNRQTIQIGDIAVTPFEVNHSAPGCLAFLIESNGRSIFYSGDLRLHGRQKNLLEMVEKDLRGKTVDVLLMEGTNLGSDRHEGPSEAGLEKALEARMGEAPGLVFGVFSPLHLDRLKSFINAARNSGRIFVPDLYTAYIMHMFQVEGFISPSKAGAAPVFFNVAGLNKIRRSRLNSEFQRNLLTREVLLANCAKYALPARFSTFDLDFPDIPRGSTLVYSLWRGYLDQPDWQTLISRVHAARSTLIFCHTSGHIRRADIKQFIEVVSPKRVVPIHTTAANAFPELGVKTLILGDQQSIDLSLVR